MRGMVLGVICLVAAALAGGPAQPSPLHEAFRLEALSGELPAAAARYAAALDTPASSSAAGLGLARCLERLGRHQEAALAFGWVASLPRLGLGEEARALAGAARCAPGWLQSTETAPGHWVLSRTEVQDVVAGAFQILSRLKVEPYLERDGRVGGLMLRAVEADCLVARRGLKPYDIVRSVNRRPLTSSGATEILSLLAVLKDEPLVEVEIERLGEAMTLRFEILRDRDLVLRHGPFPRPCPPTKDKETP